MVMMRVEGKHVVSLDSNICTVLYCTVLYCTVLYCTVLYCTALYCTVLHCTVLYCTVLYCTVLYYTVLHCVMPFHKTHHCHCLSHHNDNEQVIANSGAAKAGVRPGDIVTALDNNKVDTFELFMSVSFTYRSVMLQDSSHRNVLPCLKYLLSCFFFLFYTYYFFIFHLFFYFYVSFSISMSWKTHLITKNNFMSS